MLAPMFTPMDGQGQIERAARLNETSTPGLAKRTPVRKSLEQLFCESRGRAQTSTAAGALGGGAVLGVATPLAGVGLGASRILQGPDAQRLDREVADFSVGGAGGAYPSGNTGVWGAATSSTAVAGTAPASGLSGAAAPDASDAAAAAPEDKPGMTVREFFGSRHERVLLNVIEEAHRECMQSLERHSSKRIQADWEQAKAQIMNTMAPTRLGAGAVGSALRGMPGADVNGGSASMVAPPQDVVIIDALVREPMSLPLVQKVGRLSSESCPAYKAELEECWAIVGHEVHTTPKAIFCGALRYLQTHFAAELRTAVYSSPDARLGGIADAWSLVTAFGRQMYDVANFPATTEQAWYAAYIAARAGFVDLLSELPQRAGPCADRASIRTVCAALARRLQAVATVGDPTEFAPAGDADPADLLRSDLEAEPNSFQDLLGSLLTGRTFAMARLPDSTVEDWLWYRLHSLMIAAQDNDQSPEFGENLTKLRQHATSVPPSRYDPALGTGPTAVPSPGVPGLGGGGVFGVQQTPGANAGVQTLNFVKVLLLTGQFRRAVQQLYSQDSCLRGPALHVALVLHRAGALEALGPGSAPELPIDVPGLVCDYAGHYSVGDQLQYFRILDLDKRAEALQKMMLRGGVGTNDELLGYIDSNGRHRAGLLEKTLHQDGLGDGAEFVALCSQAGRAACEHGQYREAIRLLHLGRCYNDVLQVLCRCLRLPIWRDAGFASTSASEDAALLAQDVERFFTIYERNLDRYALSSQAWSVARKLYASRMFHALCAQGRPEAALDIFDREQLLPLSYDQRAQGFAGSDSVQEVLDEHPRIVRDYVRILRHAASQGAVVAAALRSRVQQLQAFVATESYRLSLDQETVSALASLALC